MGKFLAPILIAGVMLAGCSQSPTVDKSNSSQQKVAQSTTSQKSDTYQSINQYHDIITGQNIKTDVLKISNNNNTLTLEMDFKVSNKLKTALSDTQNKVYLTFMEVDGQHKLDNVMPQKLAPVEFRSENIGVGNKYHISQNIEINKNATPDEVKEATNPANYEFVFLNEDLQKVAVLIGLDLSTIEYPLN